MLYTLKKFVKHSQRGIGKRLRRWFPNLSTPQLPPPEVLKRVPVYQLTHSGSYYAQPAKRSAIFYSNSYYHNLYLAQALRRRGWDAMTISLSAPDSPEYTYYHGEDLNLYAPVYEDMKANIDSFLESVRGRFNYVQFAGDYLLSFYPHLYNEETPEDLVRWKNEGNKVGFIISGCNSGVRKSKVMEWSRLDNDRPVCHVCSWYNRPDVCNDDKAMAGGDKLDRLCDVIFAAESPSLDYMASPKVIHDPMTAVLDPLQWHPELEIPAEYQIEKAPGEILIYHGVGNYSTRTNNEVNIKGTKFIMDAIDCLKDEGFPVRLIFATDIPNRHVRFIQAQADIIVDQLNYGRYGATAREGLMLGKPTISYLQRQELQPSVTYPSLEEIPLVSAKESTVYSVLKDLVREPGRRKEIGIASRQFAEKWFSPDACAERYEIIYDQMMQGLPFAPPKEWTYYSISTNKASIISPVTREANLCKCL